MLYMCLLVFGKICIYFNPSSQVRKYSFWPYFRHVQCHKLCTHFMYESSIFSSKYTPRRAAGRESFSEKPW